MLLQRLLCACMLGCEHKHTDRVHKTGLGCHALGWLPQSCSNASMPNIHTCACTFCVAAHPLYVTLLGAGVHPAAAAAGPDAVHISKGTRDQDYVSRKAATATDVNVSAAVGDAGASEDPQGEGAGAGTVAPAGPQKLRSFRLSYEDVRQEEALEEDLDDTVGSPSTSAAGLDGSEYCAVVMGGHTIM